MDIEYRRKLSKNKRTVHKECTDCSTVWCDDQIMDGGHGYGEDSCPFCHKKWKSEVTIALDTPNPKRTKVMERKMFRLKERLRIIDSLVFVHEGTACGYESEEQNLRNKHLEDISSLTKLHKERSLILSKITNFEDLLSKGWGYVEPDNIRLDNGQMDWYLAFDNLHNFKFGRDKL